MYKGTPSHSTTTNVIHNVKPKAQQKDSTFSSTPRKRLFSPPHRSHASSTQFPYNFHSKPRDSTLQRPVRRHPPCTTNTHRHPCLHTNIPTPTSSYHRTGNPRTSTEPFHCTVRRSEMGTCGISTYTPSTPASIYAQHVGRKPAATYVTTIVR